MPVQHPVRVTFGSRGLSISALTLVSPDRTQQSALDVETTLLLMMSTVD